MALFHDVAVAIFMTCLATGLRILMDVAAPGVAPYLFVFPAIAGAVMLAGMRSGLMTLASCQLFAWFAVVPFEFSFELEATADAIGLLLSTFSEAILLVALGGYRAAMTRLADIQAARSGTLRLALRELDHRTRNNLQIVQGLLHLKAQGAQDPETARELAAASARIGLIATMNSFLLKSSKGVSKVALKPYLTAICEQLREAICPDNIDFSFDLEQAEIDSQRALFLGLVLNELVTNSIKHAFPGGCGGHIVVVLRRGNGMLSLTVADDGCGRDAAKVETRHGLGSKLIPMMVGRLGAKMHELPGPGTGYRLDIPKVRA